jgi:hypothetical protein
MNTPTIKPNNTTYNAGFTPAPVETHKKAIFEGQKKSVVLNGSLLSMRVVGGHSGNFGVSAVN